MTFKDRLIAAFMGDIIDQKVKERLSAAAATSSLDEDAGWRKLTGNATRELLGVTKAREIEIAYWLWRTNPLGRWIVNIMAAFVCGDGLKIEAKNEDVQKLLNEFWAHPLNNMPLNLSKHTKELAIFGELLFPKFISQYTGKIVLGYIDPANIKTVVTDPENVKIVIGVITSGVDFRDGKKFKTVLPPEAEEFLSPDARSFRDSTSYECFYFSINNLTNEPRGQSDLADIADWLDAYEQFLFDYADKWPLLNTFVWDMIVEGGTEETIKKQMDSFTKKSGSVFGHNEKVKLEPSTPDLKSVDADVGAKLFRNHILGAKSIPSFWYGGAQDSNLAVSQEMSAPAYKMMSERQKIILYIWRYILDDVIREADAHGMLQGVPEDERVYSVNTPELASKDITKFATAIQQLSTSLAQAETNKWLDQNTAVKVFAFCLSMIGYELDVDAIQVELENQDEKLGYENGKQPQTAVTSNE